MKIQQTINNLCDEFYQNSMNHGFWEGKTSVGEKIALIHSEVSEALEASRVEGFLTSPDKHCPEYSNFAIELADAIIRIGDLARHFNVDLGGALIAKHEFNLSRPHKHGKLF